MKTLYIQNVKCGGCANTITTKISDLEGISNVKVTVEEGKIEFDSNEELVEIVKEKLKSLGYPENGDTNSIGTKAKSFVSCAVGKIS